MSTNTDTPTDAQQFNLSLTNDTLKSMLVENTGRHMLDSGGAYGRHWEENRENAPWNQPRYQVRDGYVLENTYHALQDALSRDVNLHYPPIEDGEFVEGNITIVEDDGEEWSYTEDEYGHLTEFEAKFYEWAHHEDRKNDAWLPLMKTFAETVHDEPDGYDIWNAVITENTYNNEFASLTQIIQWTHFRLGGESYVLLQIHGGCDVRGGYTKPRIFQADIDYLIRGEFGYYCRECHWTEAESCLEWGDDSPVEFDEEHNVMHHKECGGEVVV